MTDSITTFRIPSNLLGSIAYVAGSLIFIGCMVGIIVPAGLGWDFGNFYDAGSKALLGQTEDLFDPGVLINGTPPQGNLAFVSAPITSYFYAPMAMLSPGIALITFKIQNTLALWTGLFLIYFLGRRFIRSEAYHQKLYTAVFLIMALLFSPFWTIFRVGGQSMPTVFLLFIAGLWFQLSAWRVLAALCLVTAVFIKPAFAPGAALIIFASGKRFFFTTAIVGTIYTVLSLLIMGVDIHLAFLQHILSESGKPSLPQYNSALFGWLDPIFMSVDSIHSHSHRPVGLNLILYVLKIGLVGFFCLIMVEISNRNIPAPARLHLIYVLGIIFALFLTPIAWAHYLSVLFMMIAYVAATKQHFHSRALRLIWFIVFFAAGQNLIFILWLGTHIGFESQASLMMISFFKSLPLILTLIFLIVYRRQLYDTYETEIWNTFSHSSTSNG